MSNLKTIFSRFMGIGTLQRQSIIAMISQIIITFLGFFSTMYFAHVLGASVLGAYFLFLTYFSIISMVTDGGFGGAAVKRISEGEEQNEYLSAFFVIRLISIIIIVIILYEFQNYFVDLYNSGAFVWLLLALIISIIFGTISFGIGGQGKMGIRSSGFFTGEIIRIVVQVVAVSLGLSIIGLAGGFVAGFVATAIFELYFFDLRLVSFGWKHIKSLSTISFWLFLGSSGLMLYSNSDTVMIGYYLGNSEVAIYRVALQIASVELYIAIAINGILFPHISRWGKLDNKELIEESLSKSISTSLLLAIPVLAGGVLLGDKLLYIFYGKEFATGYLPLVILLVMEVITIFQQFFLTYIAALDYAKYGFKVTLIAAMLNIILNLILIPIMGISGAAVATLFTMMLNAVLAHRILSRIIKIRINKYNLFNIIKSTAVMSLFIGTMRLFAPLSNIFSILLLVSLGGLIYGILILKFDRKIYDELKGIMTQMNLHLPDWL